MGQALVVGVDGGGTSTEAVISTIDGRVLGIGSAGPSNLKSVGEAVALRAIDAAVSQGMQSVDRSSHRLGGVAIGLAGAGDPADRERVAAWAAQRLGDVPCQVVHDVELVLLAGTPRGFGIAIVSGTGAIAYGRDAERTSARAGGWGHIIGDEGSGTWIGQEALRLVARAADGRGPQTSMAIPILRHLGIPSAPGLIGRLYSPDSDPRIVASIAAVVDALARDGDRDALALTSDAGRRLAEGLFAVANELRFDEAIPLAIAGGVLVNSEVVRSSLESSLAKSDLTFAPITVVPQPVVGAIQLAKALAATP